MHGNLAHDLAQFISEQAYSGNVIARVSREMADHIVRDSPAMNSDIQTADDVGNVEAMQFGLVEVTFELDPFLDPGLMVVEQHGHPQTFTVPLDLRFR